MSYIKKRSHNNIERGMTYNYSIKLVNKVLVRIHSMWCNTSTRGELYIYGTIGYRASIYIHRNHKKREREDTASEFVS